MTGLQLSMLRLEAPRPCLLLQQTHLPSYKQVQQPTLIPHFSVNAERRGSCLAQCMHEQSFPCSSEVMPLEGYDLERGGSAPQCL